MPVHRTIDQNSRCCCKVHRASRPPEQPASVAAVPLPGMRNADPRRLNKMSKEESCKRPELAAKLGPFVASGALLTLFVAPIYAAPDTATIFSRKHPACPGDAAISGLVCNPLPRRLAIPIRSSSTKRPTAVWRRSKREDLPRSRLRPHRSRASPSTGSTDHTKANDQLKQIAMTKGTTLPTDMDRSHKRNIEKLGKLQGTEFRP